MLVDSACDDEELQRGIIDIDSSNRFKDNEFQSANYAVETDLRRENNDAISLESNDTGAVTNTLHFLPPWTSNNAGNNNNNGGSSVEMKTKYYTKVLSHDVDDNEV